MLGMRWRPDFAQYSGFLHAGLIGTLIAVGERFEARARVVKPGRTQIFTSCELFAYTAESETLVATGETLMIVVEALA